VAADRERCLGSRPAKDPVENGRDGEERGAAPVLLRPFALEPVEDEGRQIADLVREDRRRIEEHRREQE